VPAAITAVRREIDLPFDQERLASVVEDNLKKMDERVSGFIHDLQVAAGLEFRRAKHFGYQEELDEAE
jgi:hypothetical protein